MVNDINKNSKDRKTYKSVKTQSHPNLGMLNWTQHVLKVETV